MTPLFTTEENNMETVEDKKVQYNPHDQSFLPDRLKPFDHSITVQVDLWYLRRLAVDSVELWANQEGGMNKPYFIPLDVTGQALCKDPENHEYFDAEKPVKSKMPMVEYITEIQKYREQSAKAKKICAQCPLIDMCRTSSVASMEKFKRKPISPENIKPDPSLVWGGMTPDERKDFFSIFESVAINYHREGELVG